MPVHDAFARLAGIGKAGVELQGRNLAIGEGRNDACQNRCCIDPIEIVGRPSGDLCECHFDPPGWIKAELERVGLVGA
ncbi:MAG: hypothetical protein CML29_06415 [Rhizobiales bacterium]|nr:hypothetical protein [Hyphomicrobiales bacterium]MBA68226.1 hypothetical protein [Hyphomicrobiales bacterium]